MKKQGMALLVCMCVLLSVICGGCSAPEEGISSYTEAKNGVALVAECAVQPGGQEGMNTRGSGFFVGNAGEKAEYLVTNYHVVQNYLEKGAGEYVTFVDLDSGVQFQAKLCIRVYFDEDDYTEAYIVDYNKAADVAVLRLETPTDKRSALQVCVPTEEMVGQQAYAIGYPGVSDNILIDSITSWSQKDITYTSGVISRLITTSGTGVKNIQIDADISSGNSGGPLVNEKGQAVGINTKTIKTVTAPADQENVSIADVDIQETAYAINISEAITIMDRHDVPYTAAGGQAKGGPSFPAVAAGIGIAVVLLIVTAAVVRKKKKNREPVPALPQNGKTAGAVTNPDDSGYRLQGVSGAMTGKRFMIRKTSPLIIGRDPNICNVVYPAGTAGVSGKHCQVWYDGDRIYLKDLGSTHGTFSASGAKLSAGQPTGLKVGEVFQLGSGNETIVLAKSSMK